MLTKKEAQIKAKEMLALMTTKGWKTSVWDNMGWHYSLIHENGYLFVHTDNSKYFAGLSDVAECCGTPTFWHESKSYIDPNKAVAEQVKRARRFVTSLNSVVIQAEAVLNTKKPAKKAKK